MEVDDDDSHDDRSEELDGLRIRHLVALRRGAIRARSYAVIGLIVCAFAGAGLIFVTFLWSMQWGMHFLPLTSGAGAVLALLGCVYFARRMKQLAGEISERAPLPPPPPGGPDFSALSDGSQRWKNLEDIQ